jgi:beta-glucosidase
VTRPVKELKGFQRIHLKAKQSQKITFDITPDTLAYYDLNMNWRVESGAFTLMVGSSSRNSDLKKVTITVKP